MKTIFSLLLFFKIAAFSWAADWESNEIIDRLLMLPGPSAPIIYENFALFTASSDFRRVGVAFAHENFSTVHWFRQLLVPRARLDEPVAVPARRGAPDPFVDSGILFHVHQIPENIRELEYRLVINGLWTTDPLNSQTRRDPVSGLVLSVITVPQMPLRPNPLMGLPQGLTFSFRAPPGETVTVAGCFNRWDPFMFEMTEGPAGFFSINIPLPPGTYQYVFFHRGQRFTDPYNPRRVFSRDGRAASEIVVP